MARFLFLLGGGNGIMDAVGREFVEAAGPKPVLALLLQGGPKWKSYLPQYVQPWVRRGVQRYYVIVPNEKGTLDSEDAMAKLREATGIFIGGGKTGIYQALYATEPIGTILRERYRQAVPVAGLSAGAILASNVSWLLPEESESDSIEVIKGLGLIEGWVIGAHFSEWNALPKVLEVMSKARVRFGLGIDEEACVVLEDGRITRVIGGAVYRIEMVDFETRTYTMEKVVAK